MKLSMARTPKSDGPLTAANGTGNGAVRAERFHMAWGLGREDDAARHRRHLHSCPFTVMSSYCTVSSYGVPWRTEELQGKGPGASNRLRDMQKPMEEAQKKS